MKVQVYSYHLIVGAAMVKVKKKKRISKKRKDKYKALPVTYVESMSISFPLGYKFELNERIHTIHGDFVVCSIDRNLDGSRAFVKAVRIGRPIKPTTMGFSPEIDVASIGRPVLESTVNQFPYTREQEIWAKAWLLTHPGNDYFKTNKVT